jgi:hypothetical protein
MSVTSQTETKIEKRTLPYPHTIRKQTRSITVLPPNTHTHTDGPSARNQDALNAHPYKSGNKRSATAHVTTFYAILIVLITF